MSMNLIEEDKQCGCNLKNDEEKKCSDKAVSCCLPEILAYDLDKLTSDED